MISLIMKYNKNVGVIYRLTNGTNIMPQGSRTYSLEDMRMISLTLMIKTIVSIHLQVKIHH